MPRHPRASPLQPLPDLRANPLNSSGLHQLRRYAITRTLFKPTSLPRAIARLGFLQADPLRAPARAQDLILAHRVEDYRAGDLERRYPRLGVEEVFFINYGFLPRKTLTLLHPRGAPRAHDSWDAKMQALAQQVLEFVRLRGRTREVVNGRLKHQLGFAARRPRSRAFERALAEALEKMRTFLQLQDRGFEP